MKPSIWRRIWWALGCPTKKRKERQGQSIYKKPESEPSPCIYGTVEGYGHACYCDHKYGPRKCPVWRKYGLKKEMWTKKECWLMELTP